MFQNFSETFLLARLYLYLQCKCHVKNSVKKKEQRYTNCHKKNQESGPFNLELSTDIMIFILYKLYILSPNPKPNHHTDPSAFFTFLYKNNLPLFYKLWGPKNVPTSFFFISFYYYLCRDIWSPHSRVYHDHKHTVSRLASHRSFKLIVRFPGTNDPDVPVITDAQLQTHTYTHTKGSFLVHILPLSTANSEPRSR